MMNPLISVVVPVYNVEQYLEQCVESIRNQTYQNLEIILVDDGSTDNCPVMCDKFAESDARIRVIHQSNKGLSEARNAGTSVATGKYLIYVDSDDWIHDKMISCLYGILTESRSDIALCEYQNVKSKAHNVKAKKIKYRIYGTKKILEKWMYQKIKTSAWAILCPMKLCQEIPFPPGRLYEDLFTVYKFFSGCKQVAYTRQRLYFYRLNSSGIMRRKFTIKAFDEIDAVHEIITYIGENIPELLAAAYSRKFSSCSQVLRWMPQNLADEFLLKKRDELWEFLRLYHWKMMLDNKARLKNRIGACCVCLGRKIFQAI